LQGKVLDQQRRYWQQQFVTAPSVLSLPTDYVRPAVQTFNGGMVAFSLDATLTAALQQLSQAHGVSLFMTLYATFAVLLARYSGQEDFVIGTTVANRQQRELELLLGFFVNTLPLHADLSGNPSFIELLQRVRQLTLDAYAHQDIPFEQLVHELQVERNLSHSPLCQVMLTFDNTRTTIQQIADLTVTPLPLESTVAKFDLTLSLTEGADSLPASLEYNCDLFAAATIERMAGHLQILLQAIVNDPTVTVQQLPLLTASERHQLIFAWNNTASEYPKDKTIVQVFEAQAARTPTAVAVVLVDDPALDVRAPWAAAIDENQVLDETFANLNANLNAKIVNQLTYRELNERANQLAHHLQTQGVKPEVLVGICVERSLEMMVGILAILKAGGAYVPLDPTYPQERLAFMLEDSAAPIILTQAALRSLLPPSARTFCLDTQWALVADQPIDNLPSIADAANLAYVIYTSGSTGRPKGVCITQRNVLRLVLNTNFLQFTADEVFLQLAPISFDAATMEIWGALLNGGRLVIMAPGQPSLQAIGAALRTYGVTTLWLTAGLFHLMVDACIDDLRVLRQLSAGGDVLSVPHIQRILQELPHCQMNNGYGPTENTTFTCCYRFPADAPIGPSAPIGWPIANTQVYILDANLQPTPIGIPGELYAGGDGLARGYLNRPALTAEKFIANPFGGGKLYKTGDLARWRSAPNGGQAVIEFLGRIDQQVKIRGFRIELGEIETALMQHPHIQAAVVVARPGNTGARLVAYLVVNKTYTPDQGALSALSDNLRQKLPDYMVPTTFVLLDVLPHTPNGKVDRQALPEPEPNGGLGAHTFVAPRTEFELALATLWQDLLSMPAVSIHDNFFALGGHSLLLAQLAAQIRATFHAEISLRALFQAPTLEAMSIAILDVLLAQTVGQI